MKDGINAVSAVISNMLNTPIEVLEMSFPLRVEEYSLVPDSGGAGTWRGGLGVRRSWRILERDVRGATCFERVVTPPFGQAGGLPGSNAKLWMDLPDGTSRPLPGEGRLYRAGRGAGDGGGAGIRWLRPARWARSGRAAGRPAGRLCLGGRGAAGLRGLKDGLGRGARSG